MAETIISPGVFLRESDKTPVQRGPQEIGAALVGPTVKGVPNVPKLITSYSEYVRFFGDIFRLGNNQYEYFTSLTAREYFNGGGRSLYVVRVVENGVSMSTYASTSVVNTQSSPSTVFTIETLAWGNVMNTGEAVADVNGVLSAGNKYNIKVQITNVDTIRGSFSLIVRRGDDTNINPIVLETFTNLNLNPESPNFVSRVIGDAKPIYSGDGIEFQGEFGNGSEYIRIGQVSTLLPDNYTVDNNFNGDIELLPAPQVLGFLGGLAASSIPNPAFFNQVNTSATNCQGFVAADYADALSVLANKDEFDFNLLLVPGVTLGTGPLQSLADDVIGICESRGDSIAIIDATAYGDTKSNAVQAGSASSSSYGAAYWPWVQIFSNNLGKTLWVPSSVVLGGVYAFNDQVSAEWWAPAGFNRGGIESVIQVEKRLSQSDRNDLYSAAINPISTFPGEGIAPWGQKTLQNRGVSTDSINVRRLVNRLKRFMSQVGRTLIFEPNNAVTRNRFLSIANPYLESVVQRQGLNSFEVIMDDSLNTPDVIDRNELRGVIKIQPTRVAEFIILDFVLTPTGVDFS